MGLNSQKMLCPIKLEGVPDGSLVAVAMSGGVDSSVAACLMKEAGYDVVGITLQLYDQGQSVKKKGACCAGQDIYDAKMVADTMGFKHFVLDYESVFKQAVVDDFAQSYLRGETPLPCVRCNQNVKFKDLLVTAKELGAAALVTGHYVKQSYVDGKYAMFRAADAIKDQSYFLFATTKEQLDYLRFPLGDWSKDITRMHANRFNLKVADKPDSQDICFVPNGSYASVVAKLRPGALDPGPIKDLSGRILGNHKGIINFTIGQRKGLDLNALPKDIEGPLYVVALDPKTNSVFVGPKSALGVNAVTLKEVNWLGISTVFEEIKDLPVFVKLRSQHEPVAANLSLLPNAFAKVQLVNPEFGIAAGQACVFYDKDGQMLGGGWITCEHLDSIVNSNN